MRLQARDLLVDQQDPFGNDAVGLSRSAKGLTNLLRNSEGPGVIAINGEWGSGKTTFLSMWKAAYEREGGAVVEYNAWRNDYCEDVLVSLIQEIGEQLSGSEESKEKLGQLKRGATNVLRDLLPLGVRLATSGLVNLEGFDGGALGEGLGDLAERKMQAYADSRESLSVFKDQLQEFVKARTAEEGAQLPAVVVVDELDRCRPDHALRVLENIKHLFDVDGLVFVLGVDLEQLANAIAGVYGPAYDANRYLARFFDVKLRLPPTEDAARLIEDFLVRLEAKQLFSRRANNSTLDDPRRLLEVLRELAEAHELSKRTLLKILSDVSLCAASIDEHEHVYPFVTSALAVLRYVDTTAYSAIASLRLNPDDVWSTIATKLDKSFLSGRTGRMLHAETFLAAGGSDELFNLMRTCVKKRDDGTASSYDEDLFEICRSMNDLVVFPEPSLGTIVQRLELLGASVA